MALGARDLSPTIEEIGWRDDWIGRIDSYLRDNCFGEEIVVPAVVVSKHLDSVPCARLANAICREYMVDGKWSSVKYTEEHFEFKP